jgi:hypothetical protein
MTSRGHVTGMMVKVRGIIFKWLQVSAMFRLVNYIYMYIYIYNVDLESSHPTDLELT